MIEKLFDFKLNSLPQHLTTLDSSNYPDIIPCDDQVRNVDTVALLDLLTKQFAESL